MQPVQVGAEVAILRRVGHDHTERVAVPHHAAGRLRDVHEVAADLVCRQVAFEPSRSGRRQRELLVGQVWRHRAHRDLGAGIGRRRDQEVRVVALHLSLHLQRGVAGLGQRVVDDVAEEAVGVGPPQEACRPAPLRVARPRHHPAEAVLPRRQQRIALRALQDDVGCRPRGGRDVSGQRWKRGERHAGQGLEQGREMRRDAALDDPRLELLVRLLEEDLGHVIDAGALVEAAVAPCGDLLHQTGVRAKRPRRHRGDCDALGVDGRDGGLIVAGVGVAVAQQDDVLQRRLALVELLRRGIEVIDVGRRVAHRHRVDRGLDLRLVSELGQRHDHVASRAIGDPHVIARRELVDDSVSSSSHNLVALAGLGGLEDEHHGDRRLLHVLRDLDLHREGRLQRCAGVPAGSVAVGAADHDQPRAQVARRGLEQRHAVGT